MHQPLHRIFEDWASRTPSAPALCWEGAELSYAQLNGRANELAHGLTGATSLVALEGVQGPEAILGMLAILKAGKAYLPLDPGLPAERAEAILEMAGRPSLLRVSELTLDGPQRQDSPPVADGRLMYVVHTSGTTGQPRGVQVTHANLAGLFPSCRDWLAFRQQDCWSWLHPLSFGFSIWEVWGALAHGARLAVLGRGPVFDPEQVWDSWRRQRVSVASLTPSAFRLLSHDLERRPPLPDLETIVFSGEAMVGESLRPWFARFRPESPRLLNMYALSETAGEVACHPLGPEDVERHNSRIGKPLPGVDLRLVNEALESVEEGEILIRGPMIADGYLNDPELSGRRFLQLDGQPAYRTGDLARRLSNGDYEYLGRLDGQLKVAGHRLETGEIERYLRRFAGVEEVVLRLQDEQLIAYFTSRHPIAAAQLRAHLLQYLPAAVVPQRFLPLERLPLNRNGKLDEAHLRAVASLSPMQEVVQAAWMDLLELEDVGLDDDFFDLGGHSLSAMRLIGMLRSHLAADVTMRDLIDYPTLKGLAARLEVLRPGPSQEIPEAMRAVLEEAERVVERGGIPYVAAVYHQDRPVCCVANRVLRDNDPTAHAEVLAIREACRILGRRDLSDCWLISSVEPCSMCLSATHWSGIRRVTFAALQSDEMRFGLAQPTVASEELNRLLGGTMLLQGQVGREQALALMERWLALLPV